MAKEWPDDGVGRMGGWPDGRMAGWPDDGHHDGRMMVLEAK